ncbi:MAG: hypothetical protein HY906_11880 [Deltaproteobacteria bacterium]|nr:hypothetical protein [Deltaproteobacteria bacterium]
MRTLLVSGGVLAALVAIVLGGCSDDGGGRGPDWWREPWSVPGGPWPACTSVSPPETLAQKAAYYDWAAVKLHQIPARLRDRTLVYDATLSAPGPTTIVPDADLPTPTYHQADNAGLWTSLYVASQAFRHAATADPEALDNVRRTLRGTHDQMRITGVPGLYCRNLRDPTVPGCSCPADPASYVPPGADMVGNRWVQLDANGCAQTWDPAAAGGAGDWVTSDHCVGAEFAGFCWQRNVSKDEYSGHMFAAGVAARMVDDPEVQELARDVLAKGGHHLVDHGFFVTDYDGRHTRYGSAFAQSWDEVPGFNALLALSWIRAGATVAADPVLESTYHDCLLQEAGEVACIDQPNEQPLDYRVYLDRSIGLSLGCLTNYDNVSMAMLAYLNLIWYEPEAPRRAAYRAAFHAETRGPKTAGRDLWADQNPFFNFILVTAMEGEDEAAARTLVEDGVCSLERFPGDWLGHARDNTGLAEGTCPGSADHPISIEDRCHGSFVWWNDPYSREVCDEVPTEATQPAAFLLPYWMARAFGFIAAEQ